ncbi:MAG: hypothetical protein JW780_02390 [Clostridiales bacterium]|nr:hypothetical protein [Clostridiales bacterium]
MKDNNDKSAATSVEADPEDNIAEKIPMDRSEALRYFGLDESATDYILEEKYWQRIKKYRGDPEANTEQLKEINEAYEIASGKRQKATHTEIQREISFKFLGRTMKEWRVHFYYSWWKYILIAIAVFFVFSIVRHYFFTPKIDLRVVAMGHFEKSNDSIEEFAKEKMGYLRPSVFNSNLIIDNSEEADMNTMYGEIATAAFLSVKNDVLITDSRTFPFFLLNYDPIDELYAALLSELPEDQLDRIEPLWYSRAEFYEMEYEYGFIDEMQEIKEEDRQRHVYGLMITDPELVYALGFENRWQTDPPTLVFCLSSNSEEKAKAKTFIRNLLANSDWFLEAYRQTAIAP